MTARLIPVTLLAFAALTLLASASMASSSGTLPKRLEGTYKTTFTGKEVSSKPNAQPRPAGKYTLVLNGFQISWSEPIAGVNLTYAVLGATGNRITLAADPNCPDTSHPVTNGVYTFRLIGKKLRFAKVRDSCGTRTVDLTAHAWTKTK
jgi:hypothetical protein